ncbi:MAG: Clp protease ClpP [Oscillospiraceae bacterium]|nr:Clp protease ClpP [Oscillospiraceae bacterium]
MIEIKLYGTIMDNDSADIMRWWGWMDVCCPADITAKLAEAKPDEEVTLYINSRGGMLVAGYDMYCELRMYKGKKTAHVMSTAMSAATIPMMACEKRISEPISLLCIHNPRSSLWSEESETFKKKAEELDNVKISTLNAYESVLKISREEISALMDKDIIIDTGKAMEYGLIDEIAATDNVLVASVGDYMFPSQKMREVYAARKDADENNRKTLELEKLRFEILKK